MALTPADSAQHATTTRLQFNIVDRHAQRNVPHRQAIAHDRRSIGTAHHLGRPPSALPGQDKPLLAIDVMQQGNPADAVRIVLDRVHLGRDAIFVATEVDQAVARAYGRRHDDER